MANKKRLEWNAKNIIRKEVALSKVSDLDIIEFLNHVPNDFKFNTYVKELIRRDIESKKRGNNERPNGTRST